MRNQFQLARLYREVGRAEDARKIERELLNLLALADADLQSSSSCAACRGPETLLMRDVISDIDRWRGGHAIAVEAELLKLLALADLDHPILLELKRFN